MSARKRFGEILLDAGLIGAEQLKDALGYQAQTGLRLGAALVERGHLNEQQLLSALAQVLRLPVVDLERLEPDAEAVRLVHPAMASEQDLFPYEIRRERGRTVLVVAMSDPLNYRVLEELAFVTNHHIESRLATASSIDRAIRKHYGARHTAAGGPTAAHSGRLRLDSDAGRMVLIRPGGNEEQVMTDTGRIPVASMAAAMAEPPEPALQDDAVLLTEEVLDPEGSNSVTPIPLVDKKVGPFDAELGALLDKAGEAVNAEQFLRLERKFWALMRVLAKKGVLTSQDFLEELEREEGWN